MLVAHNSPNFFSTRASEAFWLFLVTKTLEESRLQGALSLIKRIFFSSVMQRNNVVHLKQKNCSFEIIIILAKSDFAIYKLNTTIDGLQS